MPKITPQAHPVRPVLVRTDVPAPALPVLRVARASSPTEAVKAARTAGYTVPSRKPWPPRLSEAGEWLVPVIRVSR